MDHFLMQYVQNKNIQMWFYVDKIKDNIRLKVQQYILYMWNVYCIYKMKYLIFSRSWALDHLKIHGAVESRLSSLWL